MNMYDDACLSEFEKLNAFQNYFVNFIPHLLSPVYSHNF